MGGADGQRPEGGLIYANGELYGTTFVGGTGSVCVEGCGTVFEVSPSGSESVLYSFQGRSDGAYPQAGLIEVNGALYGTTSQGGTNNNGTVFQVSLSGSESVLYSFKGKTDGRHPTAGLIYVNGELYGTTIQGGGSFACQGLLSAHKYAHAAIGCGTVFDVDLAGNENVLHAFKDSADGALPYGDLTYVNGDFYGTTSHGGGRSNFGTVFQLSPSGGESVLYSFKGGTDGYYPQAGLIEVNGELYGTSALGGTKSGGTIFEVSTSGKESVLYNFIGFNSYPGPSGDLIYFNGDLYGTNLHGGGGTPGRGIIFKVSLAGKENTLHRFRGSDGKNPAGSLLDVNDVLYGATEAGGPNQCIGRNGCGTIFAVTP